MGGRDGHLLIPETLRIVDARILEKHLVGTFLIIRRIILLNLSSICLIIIFLGSLQRFLRFKDISDILSLSGSLARSNVRVVADIAQFGRLDCADLLRAERPGEVSAAIVTERVPLLVFLVLLVPVLLLASKPFVLRVLHLSRLNGRLTPINAGDLLRSPLRALLEP